MANRPGSGTVIGMSDIKLRRLTELTLACHPQLHVGESHEIGREAAKL